MQRFALALLAPLLRCISNYLDKILIEKYFKGGGLGAMFIFSGLIGLLIFPFIGLFLPVVFALPLMSKVILVCSGLCYLLALIPYLNSLSKSDTSLVIPLFQMIPLFAYVLGLVFLQEIIVALKLMGGGLIIIGSVLLSLEIGKEKLKINKVVFWLMALASLFFASYSLLFKIGAQRHDTRSASFWFYVGLSLGGLLFLCYKPYRQQFFAIFRENGPKIITLNICNEIINISAVVIVNLAFTLGPLALVRAVSGLQPLFILIFGLLLTRFAPSLIQESVSKHMLVQKLIAILIILVGSFLINIP